MIETIVGQVIFFGAAALFGLMIQRATPLDLTLSCLLSGVIISFGLGFTDLDLIIQDHSLKQVVFFVILPVLIFESAWHINPKTLLKWLRPVLLLAIPGVIISCFITAIITFYLMGDVAAYPWIAAFVVGAILAATDPVAVTVTLRSLQAPENLQTLIEGESLFNDATAVLLFGIVLAFATKPDEMFGNHNFIYEFLLVCLGGHLVGIFLAYFASVIINWLQSVPATKMILLLLAFSSFFIAEHLLHVSGILAVMTAAIGVKHFLYDKHSKLLHGYSAAWEWMALLFTSALFVIMGGAISFSLFAEYWLPVLITILAALMARVVSVYSMTSMSALLGQSVLSTWKKLLVWGGLRGGIAIALVLSIPNTLPYYDLVQAMVFGLVLFTLLVQGTTTGKLIKKLKIID